MSTPGPSEEDVNRRIEESVVGLPGVERVVATATEGLGRIDIELATFADAASVLTDVQNAVDGIENFPPLTADQPEVELQDLTLAVMTLAVSSATVGENELRLAAESPRSELLELPTISQVQLKGTRDREISVELSEEELRRLNLSFNQIANIVQRASLNLTFGELGTEAGGFVPHTVSKRRFGEEFEDIPLLTRLNGTIVTLGEVAEIRDAFVDEEVVTRVNGQPAVLVRIDATEQQSIVRMAREINAWLGSYTPPPGIAVTVWSDKARPAVDRLAGIISTAPHRRSVRGDARDRGTVRRSRTRRQRAARRIGRPHGQHHRGQHRIVATEGRGRKPRQSPGVGEAASSRPAGSQCVSRADRAVVAPAGRRRFLPGKGRISDHACQGRANRGLCVQA